MRILGIETSCDETAVALISASGGLKTPKFRVLKNLVASQIPVHRKTGGVVPEVAAREHVTVIVPMIKKVLGKSMPDVIAVTAGPGLITSLRIGVDAGRILTIVKKIPLVVVNHLEGHIYANWLQPVREIPNYKISAQGGCASGAQFPKFPALCLIVSGGHTELVLMRDHGKYRRIGATRDDAAGEAFDKTAKLLGLPYPGGPEIAKLAEGGNPYAYNFPRPMMGSDDFDFSFSGLKTAVRVFIENHEANKSQVHDVAASVQAAIVDVLVKKTIRAAKQYKVKSVLLAGGVSANKKLRQYLGEAISVELPTASYHVPLMEYTGDNAAMIAAAGYFHAIKKDFDNPLKLEARANWELN